jgi:hypothetical protein
MNHDQVLYMLLMATMASIQEAEVSNTMLMAAGQCDSDEYLRRMTESRRTMVDAYFRKAPKARGVMDAAMAWLEEEEVSNIALVTAGQCEPAEHLRCMLEAKVKAVAALFGQQYAVRMKPDLEFLLENGTD